jgi:hypothetical protein
VVISSSGFRRDLPVSKVAGETFMDLDFSMPERTL